jgi:gamma-glutamylcyclotransferase (GGCT)/AIG2-like uncharacterized protein YtfP
VALMFLTGNGMSDGPLHHHISGAPLIGERRTAPRYRLYSVRDEYPALSPVSEGGQPILGELYDVPMDQLWELLANEPPELELSMVELDAQAAGPQPAERLSFGMVLRRGERGGYTDITHHGGWLAYRRTF